jgi:hypothetical protein
LQGIDPNVYVYFNLTSIENHTDYYLFNVTVYKENAALLELTSFGEYFFNFELKSTGGASGSDPLKLDKSTYIGNAQDLKNEIDAIPIVDISGKQDVLVSGTNIKTINGSSILGSGDLIVSGGGSSVNTTIWVASNDATIEQKDSCTYVCDGTADEVQINLAIQDISSSRGGIVRLTDGRFSLNSPVIIDRMVSLIGSGRGIKLSLDNPTTATDTRGTCLYQTTNTDVIKIDTPNKLQGFEIKDMLLVGYGRQNSPTGHGIHIAGGSDVSVMRNLSISDCYAGIFYNHDVTVQMLDTPWIDQCSIQRNHIGMLIIGGHLMRITNNIFWENYGIGSYGGYAFNCGGIGSQGLGNSIISNNHFGENNFIEGANVSKNSSHLSLIYSNDLVSGNYFGGIQGNSIKMTGYTSYSKVSNNYFTNFGKGIGLTNAQRSGIYIEDSQSNIIENSYMISITGSYGIYEDFTSFKNSFLNNIFQNLINNTVNRIFTDGTDTYETGTIVRPDLLPEKYVKIDGDVSINDNKTFNAETYFNENIIVGGNGVSTIGIGDLTGNIQGKSALLREDNLIDGMLLRPAPAPDGGAGIYDIHTFKNSVLDGTLYLQRLLGSVGIGTGFNGISTGKKLDVLGNTAVGNGTRNDSNATLEVSSLTNALSILTRASVGNSNRLFFCTGSTYNWFFGMSAGDSDFKISDENNGQNRIRIIPGTTAGSLTLDGTTGISTFTGIPAAPTATVGTNTTQLATTAFVLANSQPKGLRITNATTTGSYAVDWNAADVWDLTLTGATTITDTNLPTGTATKVIEFLITGAFAWTPPAYWDELPSSQAYDGAKLNHVVITCINGTTSSEKIYYTNETTT